MNSQMSRLGLSFILGLGCWLGTIEAQEPAEAPVSAEATEAAPQRSFTLGQPIRNLAHATGGAVQATNDFLHRHGYLCGQHLDWYGCGGWRAQNTFVLGSCRTFFGEPCLPNQGRAGGVSTGINGGGCPGGCR